MKRRISAPRKGAKKRGNEKSPFRTRMYLVLTFFIVLFTAISARAFHLQIIENGKLKKLAMKQQRKTLTIQSKRGDIYDRNLKELAISVEVDSIYAQPSKIESPREAARVLAPILAVDRSELEGKLKSGNFVWLKRQVDLTEEQREAIGELEGVGITKESRRYYPNRQLASNVVGFTGLDSNGLEGVERYYDNALKGASRKLTSDKDAMGRVLLYEDLDKTVPVQGDVVELTIDKTIQYIAEKELKKAVETSGAKGGMALVMNPQTGEILAMAAQPTFDPNDLANFKPGQGKNKGLTDTFEPGSVFKLFIIAAALEEKAIKPADSFFCENGSYRVADRVFHDHGSYGRLTVPEIIKFSSNIGTAKIGERLGKEKIFRHLKSFGFGEKTGVDLPGEATGVLRHYKDWSAVTLHTVSFGQGVAATGLQLVTALSSIANGGFLMKPYVVKSIKDQNGNVISENNPTIVRRVTSEETARQMTRMLVEVTKQGGTGTKAALEEFEVAGKTGTAQKPDFKKGGYSNEFMASFYGFVPADSPKLAILVAVDAPKGPDHFGGSVSAPVFREIAQQSLSYMGVFKDNNSGPRVEVLKKEAPGTQRTVIKASAMTQNGEKAPEQAGNAVSFDPAQLPDFTGKTMREVLKIARERSFEVDVVGSGKAVAQKPAPGSNLPGKGSVVVYFQ